MRKKVLITVVLLVLSMTYFSPAGAQPSLYNETLPFNETIILPLIETNTTLAELELQFEAMYLDLNERSIFWTSEIDYLRISVMENRDAINELIDNYEEMKSIFNENLNTLTYVSITCLILSVASAIAVFSHKHGPKRKG